MAYVIAEPCIGTKDTACVDDCPVDCIHPRKNEDDFVTQPQLYIDPVACIDCGACVPVCPVSAIFILDDLPEKWRVRKSVPASNKWVAQLWRSVCGVTRLRMPASFDRPAFV